MNKLVFYGLLLCLSGVAMAAGSGNVPLSGAFGFAPPPADVSVIFLGNLFGVVDGVLHGTGSQILGNIFSVFNSAVLALGGMLISYTLVISTINTAHEGQMLGKDWDSIWVPLRTTAGLGLLIPKASGYCLMQIIFMWVVVQGVGAADKVWNAALSYLNRGGVIQQAQISAPPTTLKAKGKEVLTAAAIILSGEVCMAGIQNLLEQSRKEALDLKSQKLGICNNPTTNDYIQFCSIPVPNFIDSVNAVSQGALDKTTVQFPQIDANNVYAKFNGICGSLAWKKFATEGVIDTTDMSANDIRIIGDSRTIALQQMIMDLTPVAQAMVDNLPKKGAASGNYSAVATRQYGVASTIEDPECDKAVNEQAHSTGHNPECEIGLWGPIRTGVDNVSVLFSGTEFQSAIADYNGIMLPSLKLKSLKADESKERDARAFIKITEQSGWMLAGSYFFDLISLSDRHQMNENDSIDNDTGFSMQIDPKSVIEVGPSIAYASQNKVCNKDQYGILCNLLSNSTGQSNLTKLLTLIKGNALGIPLMSWDQVLGAAAGQEQQAYADARSSTTFGYINNAGIMRLPGQPGNKKMVFKLDIGHPAPSNFSLSEVDFDCGSIFGLCIGRLMGDTIYNLVIRNIMNILLQYVSPYIDATIRMFLLVPLEELFGIFKSGVEIISEPGVNPIVGLGKMGVSYINFVMEYPLVLAIQTAGSMEIPYFGLLVFPIIMFVAPITAVLLGTMATTGAAAAYYIPLIPYMIFTFASIAWLVAVIEAMVAAPIVALGVVHPEGKGALGRSEQAFMILMNIFLRPSMMIIGYIAGISLSYVSVWVINAGFSHVMNQMTATYNGWATVFGSFIAVITYTAMYTTVVQRAFELIVMLPDRVLRWIGGTEERYGQEVSQWMQETKGQVDKTSEKLVSAGGELSQQHGAALQGKIEEGLQGIKGSDKPASAEKK